MNGDLASGPSTSVAACRAACEEDAGCGAWTFTLYGGGLCRLKAHAHRCLMVVGGSPGCFLPSHGNWSNASSTSGFKQQRGVRFVQVCIGATWAAPAVHTCERCISTPLCFAQLYMRRTHASLVNTSADCGGRRDCGYGHFGYAHTLRLLPSDASLRLHVFADRSIVEAFGQGGRAAVTGRVYPTLRESDRAGLFSRAAGVAVSARVWALGSANVSVERVLVNM